MRCLRLNWSKQNRLALFAENGPFKISPTGKLSNNPYSWNDKAWLFYVDQPVGTGFSYPLYPQDRIHNEDGVAADMYQFYLQFFTRYPIFQYTRSGAPRELYITGESYAGHYVPAICAKIVEENAKGGYQINLRGMAVGNGLTDPIKQYPQYQVRVFVLFFLFAHLDTHSTTFMTMDSLARLFLRQTRLAGQRAKPPLLLVSGPLRSTRATSCLRRACLRQKRTCIVP